MIKSMERGEKERKNIKNFIILRKGKNMAYKKASYTERELTEKERTFSEEHHYLIDKYMKIHRLDRDEWYDYLIIPYMQSVKKYHEYDNLKKYKFEQIFYRTLDNARSNYWRDLNRKKRCPEGGIYSYENLFFNNQDEWECMNILDCYSDKNLFENLDDIVNEKLDFQNVVRNFKNNQQKRVASMIIEGYNGAEVQRMLGITPYKYKKILEEIGNIIVKYI